jgi:hypothetical protein
LPEMGPTHDRRAAHSCGKQNFCYVEAGGAALG